MFGFNLQQLLKLGPQIAPLFSANHRGHPHSLSETPWASVASSSSCCEALSKNLGSSAVVHPFDAAYAQSMSSYFSLKNSDLHPACIVFPRSAGDVSTAVQVLSLGANVWEGKCQFGIRGGGHTPFKGAASIDGGIVLDMNRMPTAGLSRDLKTFTSSPGNTWDMVYEALDVHNLSTLGTKVAGIGVGGPATTCGVSYFSPRFGYICDMVENWEVVLSNGEIVNANANQHPDLWKALRGGINNFGVVTAVTLQTFEQGAFWGGQTFHAIDTRQQHFEAHARLASTHPYDPYAHFINTLILTNMTPNWFIGNSIQYTKSDPPVAEPKAFADLLDIKRTPIFPGLPTNTLRVDTVTSFSREYARNTIYPKRWAFACISFAPSAKFMETFFQMTDEALRPYATLPGFQLVLNYQPTPAVMSQRNGAFDSLGPIQTQGNLVFIHFGLAVDESEASYDEELAAVVRELIDSANAEAKAQGVYRSFLQPTYADSWQNPFEGRSESTIRELVATSKKYDPAQMFQRQVPGGFKLPKL